MAKTYRCVYQYGVSSVDSHDPVVEFKASDDKEALSTVKERLQEKATDNDNSIRIRELYEIVQREELREVRIGLSEAERWCYNQRRS